MKSNEAREILELNGIVPDPTDRRPLGEIVRAVHFSGVALEGVREVVSQTPMAIEASGTFSHEDIEQERRRGRAVRPIAFAQGVFPIELELSYNEANE